MIQGGKKRMQGHWAKTGYPEVSRGLELEKEWEVLVGHVVNVKQSVNVSFLLSDVGQGRPSQEGAWEWRD